MTKLEELKTALAAATPGEWVRSACEAPNMAAVGTGDKGWLGLAQMFGDTDREAEGNAAFIALAHNLMPALLEAVELLRAACEHEYTPSHLAREGEALLEKLK